MALAKTGTFEEIRRIRSSNAHRLEQMRRSSQDQLQSIPIEGLEPDVIEAYYQALNEEDGTNGEEESTGESG